MQNERGDVIVHGLLRVVIGLLVAGLAIFEVGSVAVNRVQLDEAARAAARAAAQSWAQQRSTPAARQAAVDSLAGHRGAVLEHVEVSGDSVQLTATRSAPVLVIDRVGPLSEYARASVTKSAHVRP